MFLFLSNTFKPRIFLPDTVCLYQILGVWKENLAVIRLTTARIDAVVSHDQARGRE
jgi:hypothetical protein